MSGPKRQEVNLGSICSHFRMTSHMLVKVLQAARLATQVFATSGGTAAMSRRATLSLDSSQTRNPLRGFGEETSALLETGIPPNLERCNPSTDRHAFL